MKIGILTFHNAYNAGAVLQAFALQSYLQELGNEVEILDYRNKKIEERYKLFSIRKMPKRNPAKTMRYVINNIYRQCKYTQFRKDVEKLLNLSPKIEVFNDISLRNLDTVIIGSDQLWNKELTGTNDLFYWGGFSKKLNIKTFLYAICMNTGKVSSEDVAFIKANINNFSSISVRESALADFLQGITPRQAVVSLDPTLLVNRTFWNSFSNESLVLHPHYVLVYAILARTKVIEKARKFAVRKHLPLIVMEPIADVKPFDNKLKPSTLSGFISAIAHADYVFTSSFHGLAFSIIFHKEVFVMGDDGRNERMNFLLCKIGIPERFIRANDNCPTAPIVYDAVEERLSILRQSSEDYLKTSLGA